MRLSLVQDRGQEPGGQLHKYLMSNFWGSAPWGDNNRAKRGMSREFAAYDCRHPELEYGSDLEPKGESVDHILAFFLADFLVYLEKLLVCGGAANNLPKLLPNQQGIIEVHIVSSKGPFVISAA